MGMCGKGYIKRKGRCIKKKNSGTFSLGMEPTQKFGVLLIILSIGVWYLRPFQDCSRYNIFCWAGAGGSATIFGAVAALLLIGGVFYLLKINKFVTG